MIGFVENISTYQFAEPIAGLFPKTLDTGNVATSLLPAILIDLALISLFGMQHSIMARSSFKQKWVKVIPEPLERSTYVLFATLTLIIMYVFWQPISIDIWNIKSTLAGNALLTVSLAGWLLLLSSTFMINHFQLFGLRQVYLFIAGKKVEKMIEFKKPSMYKLIRHPIYFSFMVIFWFAPVMTLSHLIFASGMTAYIFIGIYHEEKDLIKAFGKKYAEYRQEVPKIIPFSK